MVANECTLYSKVYDGKTAKFIEKESKQKINRRGKRSETSSKRFEVANGFRTPAKINQLTPVCLLSKASEM